MLYDIINLISSLSAGLEMDLASVILGLVICAVTAAILYFISMKSFQVSV